MIAAASTGRDNNKSRAVILIDHGKRGIASLFRLTFHRSLIVAIKLIAARIDLAPAKCREKMARSIEGPDWVILPERGG